MYISRARLHRLRAVLDRSQSESDRKIITPALPLVCPSPCCNLAPDTLEHTDFYRLLHGPRYVCVPTVRFCDTSTTPIHMPEAVCIVGKE